jgi:hypothetical protein
MNAPIYRVTTSQINKVSITITRQQLWINYVNNWRNFSTEDPSCCNIEGLINVYSVFVNIDKLDPNKLCALFQHGNTVFLMDDAMRFLDTGKEILREIIVVDFDGSEIVIKDRDISF